MFTERSIVPHFAANRLLAGLLVLVLSLTTAAANSAAATDKPFGIDAMLRVAMLDDIRISTDGRLTAFVVTRAMPDGGEGELSSRIYLADKTKGPAKPVTPEKTVCDKPRFSPDGSKLAYLAQNEDATDVYLLQIATGQARRLLRGRDEILDLAFSPDGKSLALTMATAAKTTEARQPGCDAEVEVLDTGSGVSSLYLAPLVGAATPRPLVMDRDVAAFAFSPDGRFIVFETTDPAAAPRGRHHVTPSGDPSPRDATHADIAVVAVAKGTVRLLAATEASENAPCFSPDGSLVAYVATAAPGFYFTAARIMVTPAAGGTARPLAQTPDARPELLGWSADGQSLYVREAAGVSSVIYAVPLDGTPPRPVSDTPHVVARAALSPGGKCLGLVLTDSDLPPEVYVTAPSPFVPKPVSSVNQEFAAYRTAKSVAVRWQSTDNTTIEGLYTPPVVAVAGQGPPPLLIELHGGPAQASQRLYLGSLNSYPLAVFSERGYAIFQPNVRGSDGYGPQFRQALVGDWGGQDFADLQTGIDALVARGLADPNRVGLMGWSYGGYLTAWAIGHTDRFAAASIGGGITNLTSLCGSMDLPDFIPLYLGGEAYERFDFLFDRSPLKYAAAIKTPTLFQHGVSDERVPFTQALELYTALARRGVVTRLAAYPRSGHDIAEPGLIRDLMVRNLAWFTKFIPIGGLSASVPPLPVSPPDNG
ncbi:prolyl oligopeptidase family serine peptidase [Desulfovibrio aerotolerans]|uniref:Prolyl oligopeptidase family serine peptidase n=1 Tax=Solidesulfovibrio aerotolerans TaxID=295255 RepID=A0A7C9IUZ8_9BACT|nr:prolyl oligopeptidase family serine peptidase [Solidesulfovibrio aerotolerans]